MTNKVPDDARKYLLFGWSAHQWALACGRYRVTEFKTQAEVEALRARWDKDYPTSEPGEVVLAGISYKTEPRAAFDAFRLFGRTNG